MATGVPPKQNNTELGASVSITIIIDIGRPRAVVRQRRIESVSKTPGQDPGIQSYDSFKGTVKARTTSLPSSLGESEMRKAQKDMRFSILTDALWPQSWFLKLLSDFRT